MMKLSASSKLLVNFYQHRGTPIKIEITLRHFEVDSELGIAFDRSPPWFNFEFLSILIRQCTK